MWVVLWVGCEPGGVRATAWQPGTLLIEQIDLPASATGESALVVGPTGTSVLIDVGNNSHADEVQQALDARGITTPDHVVLTHDDRDHVGAAGDFSPQQATWRWDTVTPPEVIDIGEGATLTLFLADGLLATGADITDLATVLTIDEDNASSVAGIVTWGDFDYLFAGDLTGGGKGTVDVESAVVELSPHITSVPSSGADAIHVNHHGISSSTNQAWADWLRPTVAVVAANNLYLDAPSPEALSALAPWVESVWVTEDGALGNTDERTTVAHGSVAITVQAHGEFAVGGQTYTARP